ncbi:TadE/TadG family type IV pilus assembly protein [Sphingomonas sp. TZW2008]|uniref:TadE/TadG family type IV pilus assembly protein n=1 Tax=Sphingomonas sp. TZW2008 TaxID=1917973 RepID=UPI000A269603|nr:pilus assembly protein TadG-related protein [Sphingomonas sp. TZW2008]
MMLRLWRRLRHDRRGATLMIFAFTVIPLCFTIGMGVDYARAMKSQTKLNAVADAAALVAVSKLVLTQSDAAAAAYAQQMFQVQASPILAAAGVTITALTVSAPTDANGRRTATVTYRGTSRNTFAKILAVNTLDIGGTSVTTNATAPNIDFYMLADVSGSMALPVTTEGLRLVGQSNTRNCQFACHSTNDVQGRDANGNMTDLYGVAKSYNLKLRIDEAGTAISRLATTAKSVSSKNGARYRMAIATFRGAGGYTTLQAMTSDLDAAATKTVNMTPSLFYSNGCPTQACATTDVGYGDRDSASDDATDRANAAMTDPGTGLNNNPPQGVLFIITDGMKDEFRANGKPEIAFDATRCTAIKNRRIRIAILYTEYLAQALTDDPWSQTNVAPHLHTIEPALQACASDGLYTKVTTNQDISAALDKLFFNAVSTARISG